MCSGLGRYDKELEGADDGVGPELDTDSFWMERVQGVRRDSSVSLKCNPRYHGGCRDGWLESSTWRENPV